MPSLDSNHVFTLTIDGTDYTTSVTPSSLRMIDAEGSEVDTLSFELNDPTTSITLTNWDEVVWTADAAQALGHTLGDPFSNIVWDTEDVLVSDVEPLFGGYVTSVTATPNESNTGRKLAVNCEGYITRCHKTDVVAKTYVDTAPGDIVKDLFTTAGITDFETDGPITPGTAGNPFVVDYEALGDALDRLALREGWVWRVNPQKIVYFGPASSDAAPFYVADEGNANYTTIFPVLDASYALTADEIKNKIIVHAGYVDSALQTDTFSGDGSAKTFNLSQNRISKIQEISVGGVLQRYGTDGWHGSSLNETIDSGYHVLVNFRAGYVWFYTPPGVGTNNVVVKYNYSAPLIYTKTDSASVTKFGMTFVDHVYDTSLAAGAEAEAMMNAILADYGDEVVQGNFSVKRLGLRAAQQIAVNIAPLGVNGNYTLRNVEYGVFGRGYIECRATYGGRSLRLSQIMNRQQVQPYEPATGATITGDVNEMRVWNLFQIGSGVADFGGIT